MQVRLRQVDCGLSVCEATLSPVDVRRFHTCIRATPPSAATSLGLVLAEMSALMPPRSVPVTMGTRASMNWDPPMKVCVASNVDCTFKRRCRAFIREGPSSCTLMFCCRWGRRFMRRVSLEIPHVDNQSMIMSKCTHKGADCRSSMCAMCGRAVKFIIYIYIYRWPGVLVGQLW